MWWQSAKSCCQSHIESSNTFIVLTSALFTSYNHACEFQVLGDARLFRQMTMEVQYTNTLNVPLMTVSGRGMSKLAQWRGEYVVIVHNIMDVHDLALKNFLLSVVSRSLGQTPRGGWSSPRRPSSSDWGWWLPTSIAAPSGTSWAAASSTSNPEAPPARLMSSTPFSIYVCVCVFCLRLRLRQTG